MATLAENLRTHLLGDASIASAIGSRVFYGHVGEGKDKPFVFFQQTNSDDETCLDASAGDGPDRFNFAVECVAPDPLDCRALATLCKNRLHCYRGTFGDQTVQGIFAPDQNDQYVPRAIGDDEGLHVAALDVEVVP